MTLQAYNRGRAVDYAHKWAKEENPEYPYITGESGNSTNFVFQCIMAGCDDIGCGHPELCGSPGALRRFLSDPDKKGPFAAEVYPWALEPGDMVQIRAEHGYWRSLLVVSNCAGKIEVAANSFMCDHRELDSYRGYPRCFHILGVRS